METRAAVLNHPKPGGVTARYSPAVPLTKMRESIASPKLTSLTEERGSCRRCVQGASLAELARSCHVGKSRLHG